MPSLVKRVGFVLKRADTREAAAVAKALVPWLMSATSMAHTALIAGTFALLGQYFRSERVRQVIGTQDGALTEEED